ncbi:TPA: dATP/dGTP pyrophosphohydrolase domain-containing protein [Klebsiella pneumoniae]
MTKTTITRERLEALANAEYCKSNPGAWLLGLKEVNELARIALAAKDREQVRREHAEWSQATFGNVGPVGPLKHLSKEALEAAAEPGDLSEWADMQFLLWDAQRRAGVTDEQITQAMIEKLAVNKQREWPEPKDGEPRLHIKAQPAPIASVCTCPSGDGSLRWPCPVHPGNSPAQSYCCPAQNSVSPAQDGNSLVIPNEMTSEQAYEIGYYYGDPVNVFARGANWMRQHIIDSTLAAAQHDTPALNSVQSVVTVPGKWIPVSERMPEVGDIVLTAMGGVVNVGETECSAANCRFFTSVISGRELPATHWMQLPAAPQEVKGE